MSKNTIFFLWLFVILMGCSGCGVMPGMKNPDISQMHNKNSVARIPITPTLIRITPDSVLNDQQVLYVYRIAPADVLDITVWEHPELSPQNMISGSKEQVAQAMQHQAGGQGILVNAQGNIYFPLIGQAKVAGKTLDEIRVILTNKLKKYIKKPEVNVRVSEFRGRKMYVFGEVRKPGFIALNDQPLSITEAIVLAGGFDANAADPSHIYVVRGEFVRPKVYWLDAKTPEALLLAEHFILKPGDIIFVSSAPAARWNRVIGQILPTVQTVWYTNAIIRSNY